MAASATYLKKQASGKGGGTVRKAAKRRFGQNATVDPATAARTRARAKALGYSASEVSGPITGYQARAIRKARAKQKASRSTSTPK